jgi:glycosyltransferase involved in cell wall biosynthesis
MKWILLSPFTHTETPGWLFDHIDPQSQQVKAVPAAYQHDRSRAVSGLSDWRDYFVHGLKAAWRLHTTDRGAGVITAFPQLAAIMAVLKRAVLPSRTPILAWCFNMRRPYAGHKGVLARFSLGAVHTFVVHSRAEIGIYAKWLGLPESRFEFVPLSAAVPALALNRAEASPEAEPYIVSLGTANRDYRTLIDAVRPLGIKTIIVAGPHALKGIDIPAHVEVRSGLTLEACHRLAQGARLNVIPIADVSAASGQVTLIEAMMLGCPLLVTECAGTVDYVSDGEDARLVPPREVKAMREAIEQLWADLYACTRMARAGQQRALSQYTFKAVGVRMAEILGQIERGQNPNLSR